MASIQEQLDEMAKRLPQALQADRHAAVRALARMHRAAAKGEKPSKTAARCQQLRQRIDASIAIRQYRSQHQPKLTYDANLPICAKKEQITAAIAEHPVVIVAGETGSGKTTQLPKFCLDAGRGVEGFVGITQPRRIAATSVGRRIAQELDEPLGRTVGYKIRFKDTVGENTRIKLMTDGILLAEAHSDPYLNQYDTLIVDEAHERSLNIDFTLGLLRMLLQKRRDLKVIITSATIDTQKFSQAFNNAPIIEVSGRMYPVKTLYDDSGDTEHTHIERAVSAVDQLYQARKQGDMLIFMPTEQDIRDTCEMLKGRRLPATEVIPLFARLSAAEQQKVFRTRSQRKIVVATNVAETSITIPGINMVVDTGLARISRYTPRSRTTTLPVSAISRSSADQRQGRCGRMANGICVRLYSEEDYQGRPQFTAPEILRANLAEVILRMIALNLGDVEQFPFIDPPSPASIKDGYNLLLELGAISEAPRPKKRAGKFQLTPKGRLMSKLPLDPRLSCMLLEARDRSCLDDVAIIASALSIQDPRERPAIRQKEVDQAHAPFISPTSDFITLLRIWHAYQQRVRQRANWRAVKQFCYERFLSFRRMREWQDIYHQIIRVLGEHRIRVKRPSSPPSDEQAQVENSWYAAVHQSILCGFLSNIAHQKEGPIFQAAHNRQVMVFPGSGLFKKPGQWIMAAEMVETSRLFARCAATIDPAWIEPVAALQCKRIYLDPHWERKRQQVVATEQVSLYGLIIAKRTCAFGPVQPEDATRIFIQSAIIDGDVRRPKDFMKHNHRKIEEIQEMEDRLRRKDLLLDNPDLLEFYEKRLQRVYDWPTLNKAIKRRGGDGFLRLRKKDLLCYEPEATALAQFPDRVISNKQALTCTYRFEPGKEKDGITVNVPAEATDGIAGETFEWVVPGLLVEKITALIKALPKPLRKQLTPIADTAAVIAKEMPNQRKGRLANALSRFISDHYGVAIAATAWDESSLPDHLRMRIAITDAQGKIVACDRDPSILGVEGTAEGPCDAFEAALASWEKQNISEWNFGDLADTVTLADSRGRSWTVYPALETREDGVVLTAFLDPTQARRIHPQGVKALIIRHLKAEVKFLRKNIALPQSCSDACRYFDGIQMLTSRLADQVIDDLMAKNIRQADGFHALVSQLERDGFASRGQTKRKRLLEVICAYADLRSTLYSMEKTHASKGPALAFLEELRVMLNNLVPKHFIQLYDHDRLQRLVRYMQAMALRAQRGLVDLEKDRTKAANLIPFQQRLDELVKGLNSQTSPQRRQAIESFLWMLEEYKISLFAQEIKTAHPISAKRLEKQLEKIDGLV